MTFMIVISDFLDDSRPDQKHSKEYHLKKWRDRHGSVLSLRVKPQVMDVRGGYLQRLPLACINAGIVDRAEIWHHTRSEGNHELSPTDQALISRSFQLTGEGAPYVSDDMLAFLEVFGPPDILVVLGLGVCEDVLEACAASFKIYNSIDAPALRIPEAVSRHFDLVLTGAEWQSEDVARRHPDMETVIMPIGPEFASDTTFFPTGADQLYDIIYVAAAQAYKRHDILFNALSRLPRTLRTLCVFGYGEDAEKLQDLATSLGIDVDFIGPPGVSIEAVNGLMNSARIGVVCGVDDGAPAILTEYMLAGLPVLANEELCCGTQYITPRTGELASAQRFHLAITEILGRSEQFSPRSEVQNNWTWQHTVERLRGLIASHRKFHSDRNIESKRSLGLDNQQERICFGPM
ncbi:Glycosyl transferases group 1 [Phyllobacterium sp. CL33Tsu]|uniref:glycosyltransferase n=1 Tax=Phyllobacterium sp. CL33Tsu TaxID=1798191 RepID=UPI0008EDE0ED|nr:glycosyltransferase [Phyllobacterium sp. CL33Tsu]SFJ50260.1 Glycosyl transferases group 1 [Phyllobacterium sp. CL33Tsu]